MKAIWKFKIRVSGLTDVEMPKGSKILSFQSQEGKPVIWALVDPDEENEVRWFCVYVTGEDNIDAETTKYIGTSQFGPYVGHLFEDISDD